MNTTYHIFRLVLRDSNFYTQPKGKRNNVESTSSSHLGKELALRKTLGKKTSKLVLCYLMDLTHKKLWRIESTKLSVN